MLYLPSNKHPFPDQSISPQNAYEERDWSGKKSSGFCEAGKGLTKKCQGKLCTPPFFPILCMPKKSNKHTASLREFVRTDGTECGFRRGENFGWHLVHDRIRPNFSFFLLMVVWTAPISALLRLNGIGTGSFKFAQSGKNLFP